MNSTCVKPMPCTYGISRSASSSQVALRFISSGTRCHDSMHLVDRPRHAIAVGITPRASSRRRATRTRRAPRRRRRPTPCAAAPRSRVLGSALCGSTRPSAARTSYLALARADARHEQLPHARRPPQPHRMAAAVPAVKSPTTDTRCAFGAQREAHAVGVVDARGRRAEQSSTAAGSPAEKRASTASSSSVPNAYASSITCRASGQSIASR